MSAQQHVVLTAFDRGQVCRIAHWHVSTRSAEASTHSVKHLVWQQHGSLNARRPVPCAQRQNCSPAFLFPAGLGKGGQQIQSCRKAYISAIQLLVQLANLQTAFITLDTALKVTNRRVNALENVVKPRIENTISYIKVNGVELVERKVNHAHDSDDDSSRVAGMQCSASLSCLILLASCIPPLHPGYVWGSATSAAGCWKVSCTA